MDRKNYDYFEYGFIGSYRRQEKWWKSWLKALGEVALGFIAIGLIFAVSFGIVWGLVASFNLYNGYHLF